MTSVWRKDLFANANRTGVKGFIVGWFMNPGFAVATLYRTMRWGRRRGGAIGRLISVLAWRRIVKGYGCYIDPMAEIGPGVRFPHPVGIVVGSGTVIGPDATIYQNVTLGRRNVDREAYPRLGSGVTVYVGATLIGEISVGDGAIVAAQSLVREDLPAKCIAAGSPAQVIAKKDGAPT